MPSTIRSVSLVKWSSEADRADVEAFLAALDALPGEVGGVLSFSVGSDAGLRDGNHDLVVIAEFASEEDFAAYNTHPAHQAIRDRWLGKLVVDPAVIQYRT